MKCKGEAQEEAKRDILEKPRKRLSVMSWSTWDCWKDGLMSFPEA